MRLRDFEFGNVWGQSGVQNFYGEGYPFHKLWKPFGLTFNGSTLVTKTTTVLGRPGKMPLKQDGITPKEFYPKCIYVDLLRGLALNAVSLSGPGLVPLLDRYLWQKMFQTFMISYMSAESTEQQRLEETREFTDILRKRRKEFHSPFAVQRNYSCPNVGAVPRPTDEFVNEVHNDLNILGRLGMPVVVKLSVTTSPQVARRIAEHDICDAVTVSNTVPWLALRDKIDWKGLFGSEVSPLQARVGMDGGLSGKPLLQLVLDWIQEAMDLHFPKPIAAGGGVLGPHDGVRLAISGAQAVCIGSMTMLRPWLVQKTIDACNHEFAQQKHFLF